MKTLEVLSIVGLVVVLAGVACLCDEESIKEELAKLHKDVEFLFTLTQKYLLGGVIWHQSGKDGPYWVSAGHVIGSMEPARRNIIGNALEQDKESDLSLAYEDSYKAARSQIEALKEILKMGDMKSTELGSDIIALEDLFSRRPEQV